MKCCNWDIKSFYFPFLLNWLNLAHSLGCKLRSHCFHGWSCGVCRDAWLVSGVTRQPKVSGPGVGDGAFTIVTSTYHGSDKSYGKTWNPRCLSPLKPWNIAGVSCHQRQRVEKKKKHKYGNQSGSWQCDSSLWWVSAPFSLCMKVDQLSETGALSSERLVLLQTNMHWMSLWRVTRITFYVT